LRTPSDPSPAAPARSSRNLPESFFDLMLARPLGVPVAILILLAV
jgi:hypothetical protein